VFKTGCWRTRPSCGSWLEAGAHFYVLRDASRMAKDVDAALQKNRRDSRR